jgi:hypothetical protein
MQGFSANFDTGKTGLLLYLCSRKHRFGLHLFAPNRPRRLARPRTSPFHGGNTGSNPVGDANKIKGFHKITAFHHDPI